MTTLNDILPNPKLFLDQIFLQLKMKNIFALGFECDHICYRIETIERYEKIKNQLLSISELLAENDINGRLIAVFKLEKPVRYDTRDIYLIELPAPKNGSFYAEGWEHAEFVVDMDLEEFVASYPFVDFDEKGMSKAINRDARVQLGKWSVKFHEQSLEEVIEEEQAEN